MKSAISTGDIGVPYPSNGLLKELDKLDAEFFGFSHEEVNRMEPATRIHMEVTYEAIADAGYDAIDLKGTNTGIYNAGINDDAQKVYYEFERTFDHLEYFRTMMSNKTTQALGFTGPSFTVDSGCSSSNGALWMAVNDMRQGVVDAAVVSGCQLQLHPFLARLSIGGGFASKTGNAIPFDETSDGMTKAEAIVAIFVQKAKVARRVYATIEAIRFCSSGRIPEGKPIPTM
ncbi:fatty acid synthase [Caerostris extrusa]|uniref:Fatty acid synthase n=1 Tax=Caerostris extrusa TaxID=172846 RepID=A0AAV4M7I6_CAEEX|nr:fatty acid synthase [Caerostris extrusa]